jgi:Oxidoreductase family, C-terminal alpha/beta domain
MRMGKHVYCQKPLTHTVYEARLMRDTANQYKVATQMGNQGTAEDGLRRAVEIIQAGVIGPVKEVHVWTDRPIWPQGGEAIVNTEAGRAAALAALHGKTLSSLPRPSVPKHVHWDLFLGTAPQRPYDRGYHPFAWRGWWDFGTGALGDMACHTANMAFRALKLTAPTTIEAKSGAINPETFPTWAEIVYEFPAREGMPPVKFVWHEGQENGKKKLPPEKLFHGEKIVNSGSLLIGEKGILYSPNDYGAAYVLLPKKEFVDYKGPEPTLPRRDGNYNTDEWMKLEWLNAAKGGPKPMSNFDFAAALTESILLGNVAMRVGKKLEWDAANLKCKNCPEADQYIRTEYRAGWSL